MANNPYVNKVVKADGTTIIDITGTTAVASDVASGKYFFTASGALTLGTGSGGIFYVELSNGQYVPTFTHAEILDAYENSDPFDIGISTGTAYASAQYQGYAGSQYINGTYLTECFEYLIHERETTNDSEVLVTETTYYFGLASGVDTTVIADQYTYWDTSDATATASKVLASETFYDANGRQTGNIATKTSSDLQANGATVSVPSGYYASNASKAVASGTEGTPTATKGSVSNHSVSVTPSVTNTTGYITGSTKTGTAVTVSASELVSGSETKTENGTYDVTNLAELVVNVSGGTSVQTKTGTFTGSNDVSVDISCNFAPDLIYVYGNLSGNTSNRGVISITIVKDTMILQTSDSSSSSASENASYYATSGVSGYVGDSSHCHATYSNSTLTIATGSNTSSNRFTSGITYSYELLKWTT